MPSNKEKKCEHGYRVTTVTNERCPYCMPDVTGIASEPNQELIKAVRAARTPERAAAILEFTAPEDKKPDETVEQVARQFEDAGRHTMAQFVRAGNSTEQVENQAFEDVANYVMNELDKAVGFQDAPLRDQLLDAHNSAVAKAVVEALEGLMPILQEKYDGVGRGSRPKFSRDNETKGEWYTRGQGFKSGMLIAQGELRRAIAKYKDNSK